MALKGAYRPPREADAQEDGGGDEAQPEDRDVVAAEQLGQHGAGDDLPRGHVQPDGHQDHGDGVDHLADEVQGNHPQDDAADPEVVKK